jgi:riboflavin kinase
LRTVKVKGKVISGKGEAGKYVQLPWVQQQVKDKVGFIPQNGTLNVMLSDKDEISQELRSSACAEITPQKGFCLGRIFKAEIGEVKCAVLIPQTPDYPKNILEVIAPRNLKDELHITDGNTIELTITLQ